MFDWLFTPVHKVIKMTPLTCATTVFCISLGVCLPLVSDDFLAGLCYAFFFALVVALLNLGVHELHAKLKERDKKLKK